MTASAAPLLGYHLYVGADGTLTHVVPDYDYPNGDLGHAWTPERWRTVKAFAVSANYDRLVIHTPVVA